MLKEFQTQTGFPGHLAAVEKAVKECPLVVSNPNGRVASNLRLEKDVGIASKPEQVIPHSNEHFLFACLL